MERTLYDAEHEDLRGAAREFLERHVIPRHEESIMKELIGRELGL